MYISYLSLSICVFIVVSSYLSIDCIFFVSIYLCSYVSIDLLYSPSVSMYVDIYLFKSIITNLSAWAGYDTRSIFKRSLTGLNSEFSFS